MMNPIRGVITAVLMLAAAQGERRLPLNRLGSNLKEYVSSEGRVVDPADSRKSPPPKGKATPCSSRWRQTIATLSASCSSGPRTTWRRATCVRTCRAGTMGQKSDEEWTLLDSNSASDSDLWIARSLLEAGRLWQMPQYTEVGKALCRVSPMKK